MQRHTDCGLSFSKHFIDHLVVTIMIMDLMHLKRGNPSVVSAFLLTVACIYVDSAEYNKN